MPFALYWDDSAEDDQTYEKVRRAIYATKAEAIAQAEVDLDHGKRVLCIEQLSSVERDELNRGKVVWEPK
jgi:hypothetical protein